MDGCNDNQFVSLENNLDIFKTIQNQKHINRATYPMHPAHLCIPASTCHCPSDLNRMHAINTVTNLQLPPWSTPRLLKSFVDGMSSSIPRSRPWLWRTLDDDQLTMDSGRRPAPDRRIILRTHMC
jgi:hypothetical protein